jgi:hypothetical protein
MGLPSHLSLKSVSWTGSHKSGGGIHRLDTGRGGESSSVRPEALGVTSVRGAGSQDESSDPRPALASSHASQPSRRAWALPPAPPLLPARTWLAPLAWDDWRASHSEESSRSLDPSPSVTPASPAWAPPPRPAPALSASLPATTSAGPDLRDAWCWPEMRPRAALPAKERGPAVQTAGGAACR